MCDTFVALGSTTLTGSVLLAKNADTEVNEAQHLLKIAARAWPEGAQVRTGQAQAEDDASSTNEFITFLQGFLLAFAGIALFHEDHAVHRGIDATEQRRDEIVGLLVAVEPVRQAVPRLGDGRGELGGDGALSGPRFAREDDGAPFPDAVEHAGQLGVVVRVDDHPLGGLGEAEEASARTRARDGRWRRWRR